MHLKEGLGEAVCYLWMEVSGSFPKLRRSEDKESDVTSLFPSSPALNFPGSIQRSAPKPDNSHYVLTLRPPIHGKIVPDSDTLSANPHFSVVFCYRTSMPELYSKPPGSWSAIHFSLRVYASQSARLFSIWRAERCFTVSRH